ncbi:hypothetical protein Tco_1228129 [Tanacetum coccineum]
MPDNMMRLLIDEKDRIGVAAKLLYMAIGGYRTFSVSHIAIVCIFENLRMWCRWMLGTRGLGRNLREKPSGIQSSFKEQEQKVTEDARTNAEQDAGPQRYATEVIQEKHEVAAASLAEMENIAVMEETMLEATLQYRCGQTKISRLEFDNVDRPECNNLLSIYQIITNRTKEEVAQEVQDMNLGTFKPVLTVALIDHLQPIQIFVLYMLQRFKLKLIRGLERAENLKWPDYNSLGEVAAVNHTDFQANTVVSFIIMQLVIGIDLLSRSSAIEILAEDGNWMVRLAIIESQLYWQVILVLDSFMINLVPSSCNVYMTRWWIKVQYMERLKEIEAKIENTNESSKEF